MATTEAGMEQDDIEWAHIALQFWMARWIRQALLGRPLPRDGK